MQHSLAPSTRTSYSSAKHCFINSFTTVSTQMAPPSPPLRKLLCKHLTPTHQPQTFKLYLLELRTLHLEHGLLDSTAGALNLRHLMRGIKRVYGTSSDPRLLITPSLLRSFASFLNLLYPDYLTFWAAILLAFFAFLQSGELLSIHHSDLHRTEEGYQVQIRQSETDPFHSGPVIRVLPSEDPSLCASSPGLNRGDTLPPPKQRPSLARSSITSSTT